MLAPLTWQSNLVPNGDKSIQINVAKDMIIEKEKVCPALFVEDQPYFKIKDKQLIELKTAINKKLGMKEHILPLEFLLIGDSHTEYVIYRHFHT